ncbi:hypothetical protein ACS0TY_009543 [Phlomoides rotata]
MAMAARITTPLINSFIVKATTDQKPKTVCNKTSGRRHLLLLSSTTLLLPVDSKTDLLDKYLKKSQENKAKNDKERLDSFYKRNYKDYFGYLEGDLRQKEDLTETEKGILKWLDANK